MKKLMILGLCCFGGFAANAQIFVPEFQELQTHSSSLVESVETAVFKQGFKVEDGAVLHVKLYHEELNDKPFDFVLNVEDVASAGTTTGFAEVEKIIGGQFPYMIDWSNGGALWSIGSLPEGDYWVEVSDGTGQKIRKDFSVVRETGWDMTTAYHGGLAFFSNENRTVLRVNEDGWCTASVMSNAELPSGEPGWFEFTLGNPDPLYLIGLSPIEEDVADHFPGGYLQVEDGQLYALRLDEEGQYTKELLGAVEEGDVLRLEVKPDTQQFIVHHNGEVLSQFSSLDQNYAYNILLSIKESGGKVEYFRSTF